MANALDWPRPVRQAVTLLLILLFLAGGYFGIRYLMNSPILQKNQPTIVHLNGMVASMEIQGFGSNVIARDGDRLICVSPENKPLWNVNMDPGSSFNAENEHVAVWKDKRLSVFDDNGNQLYAPQELEDTIWLARCGYNMTAVIVGQRDKYLKFISKEAKVIETVNMVKRAPMNIRFFSREDLLWYSTLETGSTAPISSVQVLQPSRRKLLGIDDANDELLYSVVFNANRNEFVTIGTHTVSFFDQTMISKPNEPELQVYGWQLVDAAPLKNYTCMVYTPATQAPSAGANQINDIRVFLGSSETEIRLPASCLSVLCGEKAIYAVSVNQIYIYDYPQPGKAMSKQPRAISTQGTRITRTHALLAGDRLVLSSGENVFVLGM